MRLNIQENSVCILVEQSDHTDRYLPVIKELLVELLLEKCSRQDTPEKFRFNIAYFDREPTFWAGQVTECTETHANSAAQWIRSWTTNSRIETTVADLSSSRPRTMVAIVAAFEDPFVSAVYLLTASNPFENASDFINQVKYASKDRPVHVVFLTTRSKFDEKALETLHMVSRKTNGTFRAVYYEEKAPAPGQLIEIPAIRKSRSGLLKYAESSLDPFSNELEKHSYGSQLVTSHDQRLQKNHSGESFREIIIKTPSTASYQPGSIGRDIIIPIKSPAKQETRSHSPFNDQLSHFSQLTRDQSFFQNESLSAHVPVESYHNPKMEMKNQFSEFYLEKEDEDKKKRKRSHKGQITPKSVEFEDTAAYERSTLSSPSSVSSFSYSSSDKESLEKEIAVASRRKSVWHRLSQNSAGHCTRRSHTPNSTRILSPGRTPGRNVMSPVVYSKSHYTPLSQWPSFGPLSHQSSVTTGYSPLPFGKPAWRPPSARRHFSNQLKNASTEDRSQAWMDRWMTEWVKRHEPKHAPHHVHAAIQADVQNDVGNLRLQRSKSEPRKLHVTTYTQTPHEEKKVEEEIHTIRDLLVKNNDLLDSLSRSHNVKKLTPRPRQIQDIEKLALANYSALTGRSPRPFHTATHAIQNISQGHQTRRDQLQNAIERKEEIRRQQEQSCYRAMYQKLAGDLTRRGAIEKQPPVKMYTSENDMELIARLPTRNAFQ